MILTHLWRLFLLPSLKALKTFESAARLSSFKAAAAELNLTPTAISHQVRGLEQALGHALFLRRVRKVELTQEGEDLVRTLTPSFRSIDIAVEKLMTKSDRRTVTLGAGPLFAARWLAPRLGRFWRDHPDLDLRLHHSPLPVHEQMERYDMAVAWGDGNWANLSADFLLGIETTPVYASSLLHGTDICAPVTPGDVVGLPLLHHRDRIGWQHWLGAAGVADPGALPGPIFEDANVLLQAAVEGQGVALGFLPLVNDEIASGRLTQPWPLAVRPKESYHLLYRTAALDRDPVNRVREWLLSMNPVERHNLIAFDVPGDSAP